MKTCHRCKETKPFNLFLKTKSHCSACNVKENKEWRAKNSKKLAEHQAKYRQKHKEQLSDYYKKWRDENRATFTAYQKSRKSRVKQAIPKWADLKAIEALYLNCPKGFHVDHIVPIKGKNVSGLHVIYNLQYLPAIENLKKSNKHA